MPKRLRPTLPVRLSAMAALAAMFLLQSCDGGGRPSLAIATNREFEAAAALALDDARAEWGELPGDTVIAFESETRAALAISSASTLAERGVAAVIGHSNSAASLAAAPIYNENEIVQLSPQSSASAYSQAGPFSFRLVPPDDRQGAFLAQSLRGMEGIERIVVFYVNDDYGRGLRSTLLAALGTGRPEVVGEAPHLEGPGPRPEDVDLARRVVEEARPDAIVWLGRAFVLQRYLPTLRAITDAPIVGGDAVSVAEAGFRSSPAWSDVWYVDFVDMAGTPAIVEFGRRFTELAGRPPNSADALTYDATRLLLGAMRDGATTGPEIRDWLNSLGRSRRAHEGVTGPVVFDEAGDVNRTYVLRAVTGTADASTGAQRR